MTKEFELGYKEAFSYCKDIEKKVSKEKLIVILEGGVSFHKDAARDAMYENNVSMAQQWLGWASAMEELLNEMR